MKLTTNALILGALALVFLAIFMTVVLPLSQSWPATALAGENGQSYSAMQLRGKAIYQREGCFYCHTQQVRPVEADFGLGPVSQAGDYAADQPVLLGTERTGPDLAHVASRGGGKDTVAWHILHLQDPARVAPQSIMPRYDYLSADDLKALAEYLVTLK